MSDAYPSPLTRFFLAFIAFFGVLLSGSTAQRFLQIRRGDPSTPPSPEEPEEEPKPNSSPMRQPPPESAIQVLAILQREGRLIDFLQEDITAYSDEEIGTAVRVVHQGCKKVLSENFTLVPVMEQNEGSPIVVPEGFETDRIRLTGNLVGDPPFRGTLQHRGWEVTEVKLPKLAEEHKISIIVPAEVEI